MVHMGTAITVLVLFMGQFLFEEVNRDFLSRNITVTTRDFSSDSNTVRRIIQLLLITARLALLVE